jgi:glycosyltransferase involved in cell wall biosynthesis
MLEPWALSYKARRKKLAWSLYQRQIVATATALVATSELECGSLKGLFPNLPVAVIPNGVSFPREVENCRASTAPVGRRLLFMSRVHPKKNLPALVKAWKDVCERPSCADWVLQIAGPDEVGHLSEIKALVHSFGLDSRVSFLGPVSENEKSVVLSRADVFVLPSFSENFGIVVVEALAHGLPVIATRGTPWNALVDMKCSGWVDPTPAALARAIAEAIDLMPAERKLMGARGREFAKAAFSWDEIGSETVQLYEWVLGRASSVPLFVHV